MIEQEWQRREGAAKNYCAFLLRCWQEPEARLGGGPAWRFTLVQVGEQETKKGFASLEELLDYLREELA